MKDSRRKYCARKYDIRCVAFVYVQKEIERLKEAYASIRTQEEEEWISKQLDKLSNTKQYLEMELKKRDSEKSENEKVK